MKISPATRIAFGKVFKHMRPKYESAHFGRDALFDRKIVVFAFLFLNILAVVMSVFVYREVNQGEIFLVDKKEPISLHTFNKFELEKTVAFFKEKELRFQALKLKGPLTADPYVPKATSKK